MFFCFSFSFWSSPGAHSSGLSHPCLHFGQCTCLVQYTFFYKCHSRWQTELATKCCGSEPRSEKLLVWGECQGKWRENCQKGLEVTERWTDWPTGENVLFFLLKGRWHPSREKTGSWEKKEGKADLLLTLVSQKLSDKHQLQLHLPFGHQEKLFKERLLDRYIFANKQGLVCLKVLRRGNHSGLSLSKASWTQEGWGSACCCFGPASKPELQICGSSTRAASLGNHQSYNGFS